MSNKIDSEDNFHTIVITILLCMFFIVILVTDLGPILLEPVMELIGLPHGYPVN